MKISFGVVCVCFHHCFLLLLLVLLLHCLVLLFFVFLFFGGGGLGGKPQTDVGLVHFAVAFVWFRLVFFNSSFVLVGFR